MSNSITPPDMWRQDTDMKFRVPDSDLALATVPGVNFDPTKRSFSAEELKPQPIIKKRKKVTKNQTFKLHFNFKLFLH